MRIESIRLSEGGRVVNLTVDSGTAFPSSPNVGELFYRSDEGALYLHNGSTWVSLSGGGSSFTISGDVSGTIDGGVDALTLATVNSNVGSFGGAASAVTLTVNGKGLVTAAGSTPIAIGAAAVTSGTFADARISQTSVTQHQAALTIAETQVSDGTLLARLAAAETVTGAWTFSQAISGSLAGNASTASALQTARAISATGDATWSVTFSGAADQSAALTLATVNSNVGSFGSASNTLTLTVNEKGLVTAAAATPIAIAASQTTSGTFADARVSQSSVTQHQAALTIAETQITDGTLLARLAAAETVTGAWTFSSVVSASTAPTLGQHLTNKTYVDAQVVSASSGPTVVIVSSTTQAAVVSVHYVLTATSAATTLTLPASPTVGDLVWVSNYTGRSDATIARNGSNIVGLADDLVIDSDKKTVQLRYVSAAIGWLIL
jgi:hypothetical protein